MSGLDLADAAEGLLGAPFRLHGRDPRTGLDCIGLLAAALRCCGRAVQLPTGYSLRLCDPSAWLPDPGTCGFLAACLPFQPGDAVLLRLSPVQFHLAIRARREGWVHAHAGLRRVVLQPVLPPGDIVHHWRLAPNE